MNCIWHLALITSGPSHLKLPTLSSSIIYLDGLMANQPCSHITGFMLLVFLNWGACCDSALAIRGLNTAEILVAELELSIIFQHHLP